MNALQDLGSEDTFSSDESMLRELERRDGIYSFIFHELEARRNTPPPPYPEEGLNGTANGNSQLNTNNASSSNNKPMHTLKGPDVLLSSAAIGTSGSESSLNLSFSGDIRKLPPLPKLTPIVSLPSLSKSFTNTSTVSRVPMTRPIINPLTPIKPTAMHYQDSFRQWHSSVCSTATAAALTTPPPPPPSRASLFDSSKLFPYMSNSSSISVRAAQPRFSHISTPLVRNRRHALKDSPEYKRCKMCILKMPPDLRDLFPLDPDVHAPFTRANGGKQMGYINGCVDGSGATLNGNIAMAQGDI